MAGAAPHFPTLRQSVLASSGQDLRHCQRCAMCDQAGGPEQDLTLSSLVQLVILNDDEALTSRTLWSDAVLASARHLCVNGLNLQAVLLALRGEARRRGLTSEA